MAQRHGLTPEGFASIRRTLVQGSAVQALIMGVVGIVALQVGSDTLSGSSRTIVGSTILVVFAIILVNGFRTGVRTWRGYELLVSDDLVVRHQPGRPTVELARDEVTSIREAAGKGLVLRGAPGRPMVFVPAGIEDYASVRESLARWRTIEERKPRAPWMVVLVSGVATIVLLVAPYVSENPWAVVPSAVLLAAFMGWVSYVIRTHPDVPPRLRRVWWGPLLAAAVAVARAYLVVVR